MKKGSIVLIKFPFKDLSGTKLRPALVLVESELDITVCFISSRLEKKEEYDLLVKASPENGLKRSSVLIIRKIATLDKALALGIMGKLTQQEMEEVNRRLKLIFELT